MVELFANSGDPNQMPHSACLGVSSLQWVKFCHLDIIEILLKEI